MLHRFVALVSRDPGPHRFEEATLRLTDHLAGWSKVIANDLVQAWVTSSARSALKARAIENGCILGLTFPSGQSEAATDDDLATWWGAYVRIRFNKADRSVDVLRDPTGRIECWRLSLPGVDVLFSHYDDVAHLQTQPSEVNWDYITYHLTVNWMRGDATGLVDVTELLPGEEIHYRPANVFKTMAWRPNSFASTPYDTAELAAKAFRAAAEASVTNWSHQYDTILLNLSGGLDSAIVLGLLRKHGRHPHVIGLNYVIPHAEGDERSYARDVAALHGIPLVEQEISAAYETQWTDFSFRLMRPAIRSLPLGYDEVTSELIHKTSADAIFTGKGGDHVFYDHLGIDAVRDLRRTGTDFSTLIAASHELALISKSTIWHAFGAVLADSMGQTPSLADLIVRDNLFLSEEARRSAALVKFTHPWILEGMSTLPPAKLQQVVRFAELQRHYIRYGRADLAEEAHPLYAQGLMEVALRTPSHWFGQGGIQRGFARRIFADLLPESILQRRTKSANTSHWVQILTRDAERNRAMLLEGHLVARGLVDRQRLEAALQPMALAAAENFSGLVNCLTVEMWLQQAAASRRPMARAA